jgi:hypothetical protein
MSSLACLIVSRMMLFLPSETECASGQPDSWAWPWGEAHYLGFQEETYYFTSASHSQWIGKLKR